MLQTELFFGLFIQTVFAVLIQQNDEPNGLIGFQTLSVTLNEDIIARCIFILTNTSPNYFKQLLRIISICRHCRLS